MLRGISRSCKEGRMQHSLRIRHLWHRPNEEWKSSAADRLGMQQQKAAFLQQKTAASRRGCKALTGLSSSRY